LGQERGNASDGRLAGCLLAISQALTEKCPEDDGSLEDATEQGVMPRKDLSDRFFIQEGSKAETWIEQDALQSVSERHGAVERAIWYSAHRKAFLGFHCGIAPRKAPQD
jgi:hypothetical protein